MSQYIIGKYANKRRLIYMEQKNASSVDTSVEARTLIVRGIGYRAFALKNDLLLKANFSAVFAENLRPVYSQEDNNSTENELTGMALWEFINPRYLVVRAGHTRDVCLPINRLVKCNVSKKDRKLTIASSNRILAANLTKEVYNYRPPSAYTGRGVRIKHGRPIRKAGKKDKQRGRAF